MVKRYFLDFLGIFKLFLDTSRDNEGAEHDSEPMRGNGRGTYEASSQSKYKLIFY